MHSNEGSLSTCACVCTAEYLYLEAYNILGSFDMIRHVYMAVSNKILIVKIIITPKATQINRLLVDDTWDMKYHKQACEL